MVVCLVDPTVAAMAREVVVLVVALGLVVSGLAEVGTVRAQAVCTLDRRSTCRS